MPTCGASTRPIGWMSGPRKTFCASARCCGRHNTSRIRRRPNLGSNKKQKAKNEEERSAVEAQSEKFNPTLGRQGNEKRVKNSSVDVRRDCGGGMRVQCDGAGPATGLLGLADREQPFHECAVRLVHA